RTLRVDAKRRGWELARKFGLVDVDADAADGVLIDELNQNAGDFAVMEHEVVGPAEVAGDAGGLGDGFDGGDAECEREERRGREDDGEVEAGAGWGVPGVAVAALSGGLLIGEDDGAEGFGGGDGLGAGDGRESKDTVVRHRVGLGSGFDAEARRR